MLEFAGQGMCQTICKLTKVKPSYKLRSLILEDNSQVGVGSKSREPWRGGPPGVRTVHLLPLQRTRACLWLCTFCRKAGERPPETYLRVWGWEAPPLGSDVPWESC